MANSRTAGGGRWVRLRRLVQRIGEYNWLVAGVDLVIAVLGVFIGLQANNWNQTREDRARAQAYLTRLHNDLTRAGEAQGATAVFIGQVSSYAASALTHAETGKLVGGSAWQTLLAYYQGGQYYGNHISDVTFRELMSAGDMRLLDNPELSAALGEYYLSHAEAEDRMFGRLPAYRETIRGIVPSVVQRHIWDHCYFQTSISVQKMADCPPPISEEEAMRVLAAIKADARAAAELSYWSTQLRIQLNVIQAERQAASDVLKLVDRARK